MKNVHLDLKKILNHSFYALLFLFCIASANAQQEATCKTKLDNENKLSPFPEVRINDYKNCLTTVETYFYSIDATMKKNNESIEKLKTELQKSKTNLSNSRATISDTVAHKKLEETTAAGIKHLNDLNGTLADQKSKYRASLGESFKKIIDYYTHIESPEKDTYQAKLDKLNTSR